MSTTYVNPYNASTNERLARLLIRIADAPHTFTKRDWMEILAAAATRLDPTAK